MSEGRGGPPVHPDLIRVAAMIKAAGMTVGESGSDVQSTRAHLERLNEFVARNSVPLAEEQVFALTTNGRSVPCKLYWPDGAEQPPLLFYCHGGGFRHGTLAGWDSPLRQIVRASGVAVLSIEYALAPENPFPAAFNEVVEILRTIIADGAVSGRAVSRYAAGGDSAGANLILGASIALRDAGIDAFSYLLFLYGVFSKNLATASWRRFSGYGGQALTVDSMSSYWREYLSRDETDWRVQPLHAELAGLPMTRIVVGELDPLLDDNKLLARQLEAAGVRASLHILPGIVHGVMRFNELAPVVRSILDHEAALLRAALVDGR